MNTAMEVDRNAKVFAAGLPDGSHALQNCIHLFIAVDHLQFLGGIHLDSGEARVHALLSHGTRIRGTVSADPRIDPDLIAAPASHQFVNRGIEHFSLDVPQCLINSREGTHHHTAAAVKARAIDGSAQVLNAGGILADEVGLILIQAGQHSVCMSFQNSLTPASITLVRFDLHKSPSGPDIISINSSDLHVMSSLSTIFSVPRSPPTPELRKYLL